MNILGLGLLITFSRVPHLHLTQDSLGCSFWKQTKHLGYGLGFIALQEDAPLAADDLKRQSFPVVSHLTSFPFAVSRTTSTAAVYLCIG
jgi:hypothetical protein